MPFDSDLNELVLKHSDIVNVISSYLPLKKQGKDYVAICPFHDDTNPSMHISPEKQVFKCFVCGVGGSSISFVSKYNRISYFEALKKVAEISNIDDPRLHKNVVTRPKDERKETLYKCTKDLTTYYEYALNTQEGKDGLEYLESRHLDKAMREKYRLGYAFKDGVQTCKFLQSKGHSLKTVEDIGITTVYNGSPSDRNQGRVIFPICDSDGRVVGYSARRLSNNKDEAKYVNSPETELFHKSNILYNYHIAKDKARLTGYIYVLEGFMDVFALARIGIDSAVAIMGTSLSQEHIQMLRSLNVEIRLCLDGDLPGQSAMMKISKQLVAAGLNFRIVDNQNSPKDPDEILNEDGEEKLREYLNKLISDVDFTLNYYQRTNPLKTVQEKKQLIKDFIPILRNIKSQIEVDNYIIKLSQITGFEKEAVKEAIKRAKDDTKLSPDEIMKNYHPERKVLKRLELAERGYLYLMLQNKIADLVYEQKVGTFYDEAYRAIAEFCIQYIKDNDDMDYLGVISMIENSELSNKDELINEVVNVVSEKRFPKECSEQLLDNLIDSMNDEKIGIFENDALEESLKGKSPIEQARIYAEHNKRRMKREKDNND